MANLKIGKVGKRWFRLPLETVTSTIAILAIRGSGKTYAAGVLAEEMLKAGLHIVILDPEDAWWGLRSSAKGNKAGYPIIVFGGDKADIPIEAGSAKIVVDMIVEDGVSAVVCTSDFNENEARQFSTDFATHLYYKKRQTKYRTPLHVFIDEADSFCLSEDTEILTRQGWKDQSKLRQGHSVVCFDLKSNKYKYGTIQRVLRRHYEGKMVHLHTESIDCLATPDHRVVLRREQRAVGRKRKFYDWDFCPAENVPQQIRVPHGGAPEGKGVPDLTEETCQVLGWVISDGHVHGKRALAITQSPKSVKRGKSIVEIMDSVFCNKVGVSKSVRTRERCESSGCATAETFQEVRWYLGVEYSSCLFKWLGTEIHRIPRIILERGSEKQLRALFLGLMEGDGTARKDRWERFYAGKNEGLADNVQELAVRLEMRSLKTLVPQNGQWVVSFSPTKKDHYIRKPSTANYSGLVWDITVPTGAFVARRNGTVFVTGNCPQSARQNDGDMVNAFGRLVKRGRSRGIGVTLISQRPAAVNKNVLTQVETLIVLRITSSNDHKAVSDWVMAKGTKDQKGQFSKTIASLDTGEAWVWSPGFLQVFDRVKIRTKETFDSSATPKIGEIIIVPKKLADIDLEGVRKRMKSVIEKQKAEDPGELRRRIAELQRQVARPTAGKIIAVPDKAAIERAVRQAVAQATQRQDQKWRNALTGLKNDIWSSLQKVVANGVAKDREPVKAVAETVTREKKDPPQRPNPPMPGLGGVKMAKMERAILTILAQRFPQSGDKRQVAVMAGYAHKSGSFSNARSSLATKGYIECSGQEWTATAEGVSALGEFEPLPKGPELVDFWGTRIGKCGRVILEALVEVYPNGMTRDEIAEITGYQAQSGSFGNYISKLRTLELINGKQEIKAADCLFDG